MLAGHGAHLSEVTPPTITPPDGSWREERQNYHTMERSGPPHIWTQESPTAAHGHNSWMCPDQQDWLNWDRCPLWVHRNSQVPPPGLLHVVKVVPEGGVVWL